MAPSAGRDSKRGLPIEGSPPTCGGTHEDVSPRALPSYSGGLSCVYLRPCAREQSRLWRNSQAIKHIAGRGPGTRSDVGRCLVTSGGRGDTPSVYPTVVCRASAEARPRRPGWAARAGPPRDTDKLPSCSGGLSWCTCGLVVLGNGTVFDGSGAPTSKNVAGVMTRLTKT